MNNVSKRAQAQYTHTKARQTDRRQTKTLSRTVMKTDGLIDRQTIRQT